MTNPRRPLLRIALAVLLAPTATGSQEEPTIPSDDTLRTLLPDLVAEDLEEWRERLLPRVDELAFTEIPWLTSFGAGLREAERQRRPLLLWVMNGHPLGCT